MSWIFLEGYMFLGLLDPFNQRYGFGSGSFYHQAKIVKKNLVGVLKVNDEKSRIRIHTKMSWIHNTGYKFSLEGVVILV
jgi:hypothetical protein